MLEQLGVILAAEAAARQQFEAARDEGARLVRDADAHARQQLQAAREARAAVARAVEDKIVAAAQREASRILEETHAVAAAMRAGAQPRMADAVEAIIQALLSPGGEDDG